VEYDCGFDKISSSKSWKATRLIYYEGGQCLQRLLCASWASPLDKTKKVCTECADLQTMRLQLFV
jgi:hypothetical protein